MNTIESFGAVLYRLVVCAPARFRCLIRHLEGERAPQGSPDLPGVPKPTGFQAFTAWWGRLLGKLVDLLGFGDLLDFFLVALSLRARRLTGFEICEAREVFGDSISYWRVRVHEASLAAFIGKWVHNHRQPEALTGEMGITLFTTIHFTRPLETAPGNSDMAWLIHQLTHVAQFESAGCQCLVEAAAALQAEQGYAYRGAASLVQNPILATYNREQQGEIARDYYWLRHMERAREELAPVYEPVIAQLQASQV